MYHLELLELEQALARCVRWIERNGLRVKAARTEMPRAA